MIVDQLLFGYKAGHRLLAGSAELPDAVSRVLLPLTDLAVEEWNPELPSYVTAFPLVDISTYVFARTWPAPEQPRPGCVWTHVLLIRSDQMASADAFGISALFARPRDSLDGPELERYRTVLEVPRVSAPRPSARSSQTVVNALVADAEHPAVVVATDPTQLETAVFSYWNDLWPELRFNSSFCTWASILRNVGGRPFDLHVTSRRGERSLVGQVRAARVVDAAAPPMPPAFVWQFVDHLSEGRGGGFQNFLWRYGPDGEPSRIDLRNLVRLFEVISSHDEARLLPDMLALVANAWPSPQVHSSLKVDLFGPDPIRRFQDSAVVQLLGAEDGADALPLNALRLDDRARRWYSGDGDRALDYAETLARRSARSGTRLIISGIASGVSSADLGVIAALHWNALLLLIRERCELSDSMELWRTDPGRQIALAEAALADESSRRRAGCVVSGSWRDASVILVQWLIDRLGRERLLDELLEVGNEADWSLVAEVWLDFIEGDLDELGRWISKYKSFSASAAAHLAARLDSGRSPVSNWGWSPWIALAGSAESLKSRSRAFGLALALPSKDPGASALGSALFASVYSDAQDDHLTSDAWRILAAALPDSGKWPRWDRCRRLRHGLLQAIKRQEWSAAAVLEATRRNPELLEWVGDRLAAQAARDLASSLELAIQTDEVQANSKQRSVVERFVRRFS